MFWSFWQCRTLPRFSNRLRRHCNAGKKIAMQLKEAVSIRLKELLHEKDMTQYQLYIKSGVPKSTISNVLQCSYDSVKLRIIHEICQGLDISITEFFQSPYFQEQNLEP